MVISWRNFQGKTIMRITGKHTVMLSTNTAETSYSRRRISMNEVDELKREIASLELRLETAEAYCDIWRERCNELERRLFEEMSKK